MTTDNTQGRTTEHPATARTSSGEHRQAHTHTHNTREVEGVQLQLPVREVQYMRVHALVLVFRNRLWQSIGLRSRSVACARASSYQISIPTSTRSRDHRDRRPSIYALSRKVRA